jgi:hypothetical protein
MTDRELLELAAKAIGIEDIRYNLDNDIWNPLTDDGDALRLAVKLRLAVYTAIDNGRPPMYAAAWSGGYPDTVRCEEEHGADPWAATRRAIVKAAAEIGKGKE